MNRKDVVRLWDEANNWGIPVRSELVDELGRFAALVAAAEREACAKLIMSHKTGASELMDVVRDIEAAAIRARGNS